MMTTGEAPRVSIILPTYNRAHCIINAIESVYRQSYQNIELIIIDDASTDNSGKLISELIKNSYFRTKFFIMKKNVGPSAARNVGIAHSSGNYITFLDSDSVYYENKINKQVDLLVKSSSDVGACFCQFRHVYKNRVEIFPGEELIEDGDDILSKLLNKNFIGTPAVMIKREVFEDVGVFDERLECFEDWELALRIAQKYKISYIKEVLFDDFFSDNSVNWGNRGGALKYIMDKNHQFYDRNPEAISYNFKIIAIHLLRHGDVSAARSYVLRGLYLAPNIRKKIKYAFLFIGIKIAPTIIFKMPGRFLDEA